MDHKCIKTGFSRTLFSGPTHISGEDIVQTFRCGFWKTSKKLNTLR